MSFLHFIKESLTHLAFPHVCAGCGSDVIDRESMLCLHCLSSLPKTEFQFFPDNPVEKVFLGRLPIVHAMAQYYFTKNSIMQRLMHSFKYRGNRELGHFLGRMMGHSIGDSERFRHADGLVPLPLFASKEKKRGYNQATVLCDGISAVTSMPVLKTAVCRTVHTESQTRKNRIERWQNMEDRFQLIDKESIAGRHVILVDDVITTGATLEACGRALLKCENVRLSIATLCFSGH